MEADLGQMLEISVKKGRSSLERCMTIKLPSADIDQEVSKRLNNYRKRAKLSGFRPGKVPINIINQRYGEQFRQEVISDSISSSYSKALERENLNPAGQPSIEIITSKDKDFFTYSATFEIFPDIKLKPINKLSIKVVEAKVTPSDVERMIVNIKNQKADWLEVQRESKPGDRVVIDFVGRIGKFEFEGGKGEKAPIVVGEGQVIKDFDSGLTKISAKQEKTINVRFPKDYYQEDLAGKKATFDIVVHRVEEKVLPELDKKFFSSLGIKKGGIDILKKQLQENAEKEIEQRSKLMSKDSAFDALLLSNKISIPNALVDRQVLTLKDQDKENKQTEIKSDEEYKDSAERQVRLGLIVQQIIEDQSIKADKTDVDKKISTLVSNYDKPEEVESIYRSNKELMSQLESSILEEKVVDFLLNTAKVTKKAVKLEEMISY
jgi:trigger factor